MVPKLCHHTFCTCFIVVVVPVGNMCTHFMHCLEKSAYTSGERNTQAHTSVNVYIYILVSFMYIVLFHFKALPLNMERMTNNSFWLVDYHITNAYKWKNVALANLNIPTSVAISRKSNSHLL